jgi:CTP:molybdopterin cytidylyltransferase MocA
MTVAVVILAASADSALADVQGQPRARRLVDTAWAGGAVPVVVLSPDPDGAVATALAGLPATVVASAPTEGGPAAQIARGLRAAATAVSETSAGLIWPDRFAWVDPGTLTSLIEAHGADAEALLRPAYRGEPGWPVLVPMAFVDALSGGGAERMPDQLMADLASAGARLRTIELGDPGTTHDSFSGGEELPDYVGPEQPVAGQPPDWGASVADTTTG